VTADEPPDAVARLMRPRSIAIVGVSPEPGSIGGAVLANLKRFAYSGDIHLVSRSRSEIDGRPCLPAIADLPNGIDVAVLAVPNAGIEEAVAACVAREVGAAIVYAAGFAETGEAGRTAQKAIVETAQRGGLAISGPNCIGLVNYRDGVPLTYEPIEPLAATQAPAIGVVAQSGAMLSSLRAALLGKALSLSHIVSTGNEAGLSAEDFLAFLVADEATRAIVMFAEQIRNPQRFLAVARRAREQRKPIVLMHPGRSRRAAESARTHTGAMAGNYDAMATLVRHHGVVLVDTTEELIDTAEILARFPAAPTAGPAVITNSGAFKGFALDFCDAIGLDLPRPADATLKALARALPPYAAIDNPLDTTGQTIKQPSIFTDAAAHLLADASVGSAIVSIVPGGPAQAMAKVAALLPPLTATDKPVAVAVMGDEAPLPGDFVPSFRDRGIPVFRSPERALRAMAHATEYGRRLAARLSSPRGVPAAGRGGVPRKRGPMTTDLEPIANPVVMGSRLRGNDSIGDIALSRSGTWPEYAGKALLAQLGIPVPRGELAHRLADAQAIAARIGYPVVLKAQSAALTHKSDVGGVIVNVADAAALAAAWQRLHENLAAAPPRPAAGRPGPVAGRPGPGLDGVLVEAMAPPGVEMVIGGRRDPDWGPVVMAGLGGVWVETLHDVRLMPPDLSRQAIMAELSKLKAAGLLAGSRGQPPADVAALADTIATIGALLRAHSEVSEIDINPLVVYPHGVLALDVLLVTTPAE
jgi:acetate---CoA ligase (ADP-forming)